MSCSLVELCPDRRLLDHNFEGYKLNLLALPHFTYNLAVSADKVYPDEIQYSFVHAKLFALQNHLVLDYWDYTFNYYYIDKCRQVHHIIFENISHTFQDNVVYSVPVAERKSGHFNLCLSFPSNNLAIISDGTGYLHIVDTGARNRPTNQNQTWQTLRSCLIIGEDKYFTLMDCRKQENDCEILHCLLQSVEHNEQQFDTVLTWVTFEHKEHWRQTSIRKVQGKGIVHYAAIETGSEALYVASDNVFKFTADSNNEIINNPTKEKPKNIHYTWLQTSEDITITLKLQPDFDKNLLHVCATPVAIKVSYAGKPIVDGKLKHKVDSELTTWNVQEDGQVDVLVTKAESMIWDEMIEGGDTNSEQIMDASLVEEAHRRLMHLCSETEVTAAESVPNLSINELEECDAASEEDTVLVRLDGITHNITHRTPLSVNKYLFSVKLEAQEVPALALRHDVDACIWQPYSKLINSDVWPIKHQGTLKAFGYIQSSKQNRKFEICPPNFSYSVVCESSRHIFIYQSSGSAGCQLRKRTTGSMKNIKVGQQHVFNVDKYGEVLGINATNEYLFLLTETTLIAIQIISI